MNQENGIKTNSTSRLCFATLERGIEQVREAIKRKIKPFLLENDTEIIF